MTIELLRLILAVFATYRLAQFLPSDDGPLFVFKRIRIFTDSRAAIQQKAGKDLGFWVNVNEGIHCPLCMGFYSAILCASLFIWPSGWGDTFLVVMAIAGGQYLMQQVTR